MKYIVMECNLSYAVVLDEEGRFKKAANLHYEVGQTVTDIVEMCGEIKTTDKKQTTTTKIVSRWIMMAACIVLAVTTLWNVQRMPYASVYMRINPEVRIDVNKKNMVVGLVGVNQDGEDLIEGYSYKRKMLDPVMDELVDRAIEAGYLSAGDKISLTIEAKDDEWIVMESEKLDQHLQEYMEDKMSVTIQIEQPDNKTKVTIPIVTMEKEDSENHSETYHESDYGDTLQESDYEYNDSDYGNEDSDYEDSYSGYGDVDSDYGENGSDYEDADSGYGESSSDYEDADSDYGENDSAYEESNSEYEDADSAYEEADSAYEEADSVYEEADSVYEETDSVYEEADSVYEEADSVYEETDSVYEEADSVYEEADEAESDYDEPEAESDYNDDSQSDSGYEEDEDDSNYE